MNRNFEESPQPHHPGVQQLPGQIIDEGEFHQNQNQNQQNNFRNSRDKVMSILQNQEQRRSSGNNNNFSQQQQEQENEQQQLPSAADPRVSREKVLSLLVRNTSDINNKSAEEEENNFQDIRFSDQQQQNHNPPISVTPLDLDKLADSRIPVPFTCSPDDQPPPVPTGLSPDPWAFGDNIIINFVTWNMMGLEKIPEKQNQNLLLPASSPASASTTTDPHGHIYDLITPTGHLIIYASQENGPYVGTNTAHENWEKLLLSGLNKRAREEFIREQQGDDVFTEDNHSFGNNNNRNNSSSGVQKGSKDGSDKIPAISAEGSNLSGTSNTTTANNNNRQTQQNNNSNRRQNSINDSNHQLNVHELDNNTDSGVQFISQTDDNDNQNQHQTPGRHDSTLERSVQNNTNNNNNSSGKSAQNNLPTVDSVFTPRERNANSDSSSVNNNHKEKNNNTLLSSSTNSGNKTSTGGGGGGAAVAASSNKSVLMLPIPMPQVAFDTLNDNTEIDQEQDQQQQNQKQNSFDTSNPLGVEVPERNSPLHSNENNNIPLANKPRFFFSASSKAGAADGGLIALAANDDDDDDGDDHNRRKSLINKFNQTSSFRENQSTSTQMFSSSQQTHQHHRPLFGASVSGTGLDSSAAASPIIFTTSNSASNSTTNSVGASAGLRRNQNKKPMPKMLERKNTMINPAGNQDDNDENDENNNNDSERLSHRLYSKVQSVSMWACHIVVFARNDIKKHINRVNFSVVKTGGLGGTLGNKGGLCVELSIDFPKPTEGSIANLLRDPNFIFQNRNNINNNNKGSSSTPTNGQKNKKTFVIPATTTIDGVQIRKTAEDKTVRGVSFAFVCAHLAPHEHAVKERNENVATILHNLEVGSRGPHSEEARRGPAGAEDRLASDEFDFFVFGGDLNYRIDGQKQAIESIIHQHGNLRAVLSNNDQLLKQLRTSRQLASTFRGFREGPLTFRPTYKYEIAKSKTTTEKASKKNNNNNNNNSLPGSPLSTEMSGYDRGPKNRLPSYTDRVLYRRHFAYRYPMHLLYYYDLRSVCLSDHKPVMAIIALGTPFDAEVRRHVQQGKMDGVYFDSYGENSNGICCCD
jgi:hypothetical protein